MLEEIIEIAKEYCKDDIEWNADTSILTDLSLSSLEIFDFVFKVESHFGIRFTERELGDIVTIGDLEEAVRKKVQSK